MTIPIFSSQFKTPAVWGVEAKMVVFPLFLPDTSGNKDGNHEWFNPTRDRSTHRCKRCGAEVFLGSEGANSLLRVAGVSCAEALTKAVMET